MQLPGALRLHFRAGTGRGAVRRHPRLAYPRGNFGDVSLDGLNVVAVSSFEGNIWAGETKAAMGFFIDERANERQREAIQTIFGGQGGGWPAGFADPVGDMRGIEFAPIDFEIADDLADWRVEVPGKARGAALRR
ncbi:MAG TPA: DUF1326 domain-containing protein [Candidatus Angelobacter sp.]|nr:DUF1326 domain-containing protein [Candidatus Angelobacter sp.]